MRFRDKNEPLHHPILKPANLPDFLTVARRKPTDQTGASPCLTLFGSETAPSRGKNRQPPKILVTMKSDNLSMFGVYI
jgi:hypothetical protein